MKRKKIKEIIPFVSWLVRNEAHRKNKVDILQSPVPVPVPMLLTHMWTTFWMNLWASDGATYNECIRIALWMNQSMNVYTMRDDWMRIR